MESASKGGILIHTRELITTPSSNTCFVHFCGIGRLHVNA
jgi:hypothetical protein